MAKLAYMVTWVTHNSRISERMIEYGVQSEAPVLLDHKSEIYIAEVIKKIIVEDNLKVMACNICRDHVHLVIVCRQKELVPIIQKIKSVSARAYNISIGVTREHAPLLNKKARTRGKAQNHLWAQKFHRTEISEYGHALEDAVFYVQNNRIQHNLPPNPQLQQIIDSFTSTEEEAFL